MKEIETRLPLQGKDITKSPREYKAKLKNSADDDTREKLKNLLSSTKKEIGEIYEGKVLNEISFHHY